MNQDCDHASEEADPEPPEMWPTTSITQRSAVITVSQRDHVAKLFTMHRASLFRYLSRKVQTEDARELVQETYFNLLRRGDALRLEETAQAYLFHTATNLVRDHHRRRSARRADRHCDLDTEEIPITHLGPEEYLASRQTRHAIEQAIAKLPNETRTVFLLHRFRELGYSQIAATMNMSTRTVARKMAEALKELALVAEFNA